MLMHMRSDTLLMLILVIFPIQMHGRLFIIYHQHDASGNCYEISSPVELFTSVFRDCLISPQTCRQTAPIAYAFVQTLINQTTENYVKEVRAEQQIKLIAQQSKNF